MTLINIYYILSFTFIIFIIGILGVVVNRKNILIIIISIELMLLAVNLNFIVFSIYLDDIIGQLFVLFVLTVAASESAIGLSILSAYYKVKQTIAVDKIKSLKS
uniref:NADH dehydrogenase subunit 4L n=1 Tax=Coscinodiscus wailesii TaxID=671091 RepID=A0A7T8G3B0_9STRA|nr:NADH dehydrogenase subunit 4L [Coscinodiscus wailesii]QQP21856.1 NADH dehydrogenase subunit 4L [Coscinodiscus wailesii]